MGAGLVFRGPDIGVLMGTRQHLTVGNLPPSAQMPALTLDKCKWVRLALSGLACCSKCSRPLSWNSVGEGTKSREQSRYRKVVSWFLFCFILFLPDV